MIAAFITQSRHLVRRLSESIGSHQLSESDIAWTRERLDGVEFQLWSSMQLVDRTHSYGVARRLTTLNPEVERYEIAAAFLHDVGKALSSLSTGERVLATIVGPRTKKYKLYHDHEQLGAEMCRRHGVDPRVSDLIVGIGAPEAVARLRAADDL